MKNIIHFKILIFLILVFSGCQTVMDYHMDECDLSTNQTIKDYSNIKNDAIAKHGTSNTDGKYAWSCQDTNAIICNNLEFKGEGYSIPQAPWYYRAQYYLEAPDTDNISPLAVNIIKKQMTMSGWFKTTQDGTIISKHNEYRVFIDGGTLKVTIWDKYGTKKTVDTETNVTDGTWNFYAVSANITGTRSKTLNIKVYFGDGKNDDLDQTNKEFNDFSGVSNTPNNLFIGATQWSSGANPTNYFNGFIDEIGMVDEVIGSDDISKLYKNSKNHKDTGKNGKEVNRTCPCVCITNHAPTITAPNDGDAYVASVLENTTAVATVTASDPDVGQTLTYSISGIDAAKFSINASTGEVTFVSPPDFENPTDDGNDNTYNFTVTVTDDGTSPLSDTQDFTITVIDVTNEYSFGDITIPSGTNAWKEVTFSQPFLDIPIVFSTASASDAEPTTIKIKDVTTTGFKIAAVKPPLSNSSNNDGTLTKDMQIGYFAISKGMHNIGGHVLKAGSISTNKIQSAFVLSGEIKGWESIDRSDVNGSILVIADTQTMNNEALSPPSKRSDPFVEVAISNITNATSFDIALERAETASSKNLLGREPLDSNETIGYLIIPDGAKGEFIQDGDTFKFEAIRTSDSVNNNDYNVLFSSFLSPPMVIASQNSRDGSDGGWVRFDNLLASGVDVFIQEDETNDVDTHTNEIVGVLAIEREPFPVPIANYQFDECTLNGTAAEVKDSSANAYDGVLRKKTMVLESSKVCKGATGFNDDSYVELPNFPNLTSNMTITAWFKTTDITATGQRIFADDENNNAGYAVSVSDQTKGTVRFYDRSQSSNGIIDSDVVLDNDTWYFVAAVTDISDKKRYLYLYDNTGNLIGGTPKELAMTNLSRGVDTGVASIGGETDSGETGNRFKGSIDEVKVFDNALSQSQIEIILSNEKNGLDYNGTTRICEECKCNIDSSGVLEPLEFEGAEITLSQTTTAPYWTHVDFNQTFASIPVIFVLPEKTGTHPASVRLKNITNNGFDVVFAEPQGEDGPHLAQNINFLAINKGMHKIGNTYFEVGTVNTKKIQQKNGLDEWEKIDNIFGNCSPAVVGQIQSLNNEEGLDIPNNSKIIRSRPWMTTAIDVNSSGVYMALERSETNEGLINKNETIGYMIASANIQDSVIDDKNNNIKFETIVKKDYFEGWGNSCKSVTFKNTYTKIPLVAASKNSKNELDGGWVRRCLLETSKIGLQIDEDGSSSSKTNQGYSSPPQDTEREHAQETASIFVFSDAIVIHEEQNIINSFFNALDIFKNIDNSTISTKKIAPNFDDLSIVSLNESNDNLQDYNGSVCVRIVDNGYNSLSDWTKLQFFNNNRLDATFNNVTKANKDARVQIVWKNNVVENCPLSNETNSTTSTDNFAIRPDKFNLILPSIGYAGENFSVDFNADSAVGYNETLGSSFVVEANISKPSCFDGTLHVTPFSFENGQKNNVDVNYSEVGNINITIKEKLGSEFAYVDHDDTPDDSVRLITRSSANMTILPHHFDINASFKNNYNDFTYLSTDLNMSAMLDINITAQNKQNIITKNYNNSCYAKDIDITIKHSTVGSTNLNDILYIYKDAKDINSSQNNIPKNNNISLLGYNKTNFTIDHNGTTEATFFINFDRDKNRPVNPFDFNITDINITDEDNIKGGISLDQNVTFYYGKVRTEDLKTNEKSTPHSLNVEVYDSLGTLSFKQNSLNWYENEKDDYTNTITYQEKENFTFGDTKNGVTVNSVQNIAKGNIDFTITNNWTNSDSSMIHVDIPVWLWYSKYNNYDDTIDCSYHPCFEYRYINPEGTSSIQSGIFKGSSIGDDYNATKQKVGVKTFR